MKVFFVVVADKCLLYRNKSATYLKKFFLIVISENRKLKIKNKRRDEKLLRVKFLLYDN